jgi:hypothetical protein
MKNPKSILKVTQKIKMDKIDILGIIIFSLSVLYLTIYTYLQINRLEALCIAIVSLIFIAVIIKGKKK